MYNNLTQYDGNIADYSNLIFLPFKLFGLSGICYVPAQLYQIIPWCVPETYPLSKKNIDYF